MARVTIAHEIIHSLFDTVNDKRPGALPSEEIEETLCDYGAARLLMPDESVELLIECSVKKYAEKIIDIANKYKIPRRYLAFRIFDVQKDSKSDRIEAIIEWSKKSLNSDYSNKNIVPYWSVCKKTYIPWMGSKSTCYAKKESLIAKAIQQEGSYISIGGVEEVRIGSLKGRYNVSVCAIGKKEYETRCAISVFSI